MSAILQKISEVKREIPIIGLVLVNTILFIKLISQSEIYQFMNLEMIVLEIIILIAGNNKKESSLELLKLFQALPNFI